MKKYRIVFKDKSDQIVKGKNFPDAVKNAQITPAELGFMSFFYPIPVPIPVKTHSYQLMLKETQESDWEVFSTGINPSRERLESIGTACVRNPYNLFRKTAFAAVVLDLLNKKPVFLLYK